MKWEVIDDAHETDMNNKITIWIWTILRYDKYKFNQMKMSSYNRTWFVNEIFYNHFSCSMHNILLLLWFGCLLLGFVRWTENKLRELCIQMIWIISDLSATILLHSTRRLFLFLPPDESVVSVHVAHQKILRRIRKEILSSIAIRYSLFHVPYGVRVYLSNVPFALRRNQNVINIGGEPKQIRYLDSFA